MENGQPKLSKRAMATLERERAGVVGEIWRPLLFKKEHEVFYTAAAALGFRVNFSGINADRVSPVQFLQSFAAALDNDPGLLVSLRAAGVVGDGLPVGDDSTTTGEGGEGE